MVSCLIYIALIFLLAHLFKNQSTLDMYGLFKKIFGRFICDVLALIYAAWIFILMSVQLRAVSERYASAFFPGAPLSFFIITMLALCFVILHGKFAFFVKTGEIASYSILIALATVFAVAVHQIRFEHILPVTALDILPALKGVYPLLGVLSCFTFVLFVGDEFADKDKFVRLGVKSGIIMMISNLAVFLLTVGIFGASLTKRFTLPFLMAEKSIKFFGSIERMESLDIVVWLISDILIITLFAFIIIAIISKITGIKDKKPLKSPILAGVYIFSLYVVKNIFEISSFAQHIEMYVNIALGIFVPLAAFVVGKIRKVV